MTNPDSENKIFHVEAPYYGLLRPDSDDFVFRYTEASQYDHIRYHTGVRIQQEDGVEIHLHRIRALFVESGILDQLVSQGLPEARAPLPSKTIKDAFESDQISRFESELGAE
jgi:hypothetical protein